jgi:predicted kinase
MDTQIVLIRGLPGSGKSTLAREIADQCGYYHVENDMYFMLPSGYEFDSTKIKAAQHWCFNEARAALREGRKVVVSNCFTRVSHMNAFLTLGHTVTVIECIGDYGSIHEIPAETLERMKLNFEPYEGAVKI